MVVACNVTSHSGAPMRAVHWPHVFFGEKKDIIKVVLYVDLRKNRGGFRKNGERVCGARVDFQQK